MLVTLAVLFVFAIGWLVTCGLTYAIMLCFGLTFTWAIGTGVWLSLILLNSSSAFFDILIDASQESENDL